MSRYYRSFLEESGPSTGALTTAWIKATGETDLTIINALNTLETDLSTYGLTSKIKALYPMVGGTATKHKFNFMDARDLDVAFRLTFSGGIAHSSTGVLFGGINGWAETYLQPSTQLQLNSTHASIYSRTNNSNQIFDFCSSNSGAFSPDIAISFSGTTYYQVNQGSYSTFSETDSLGMRLINRTSSTIEKLYKNSNLVLSSSKSSQGLSTGTINISKFPTGGYWSNREYSFMTIGSGLTDTEALNLYTLTQAFQTSLSRQV
jgi:hypothetical protein